MATRKIEFMEAVKLGYNQYEEGDVKSFPKEEADEYIRLGWAKCTETGETGERKPGAQKLQTQNLVQEMV